MIQCNTRKQDHILIIAPSMVPQIASWGGSQRMYYLANYLADNGKKVVTVSPAMGIAEEFADKTVKYKAYYLDGIFGKRESEEDEAVEKESVEKEATGEALEKEQSGDRRESRKYGIIKKTGKRIKKQIYLGLVRVDKYLYNEPSAFEGYKYKRWIKQNRCKILEIINQEKIDKVIISGPSFSLFAIAEEIKKNTAVKVIFDYRDPWHLWNCKKNRAYYKEKRYLKYADTIVCFSDRYKEDFCKVFHIPEEKAAVIYNGYSEKDWEKISHEKRQNDRLTISYIGSMDFNDNKLNYRNPNRIIDVIKEINDERVKLRFIGSSNNQAEANPNIQYIGRVSQQKSYEYMIESDILLNIHDTKDSSGKYLISGKFFDYMRSGRMIWNLGGEEGLACHFVRKYKLGVSCENRAEDIKKNLYRLIEDWEKGRLEERYSAQGEDNREFSREKQNEKYCAIIEGVLDGRNGEERGAINEKK